MPKREEGDMTCIASWEAVEQLSDNCPLCGLACYAHELEEDREPVLAEQAIMAVREGTDTRRAM